jgi:chromosome segregation ATPase
MAKKSLTDLLRQEVEKSSTLEAETVLETSDDEFAEQDTNTVEKLPMNTSAKPNARRATPTKAQLETTITKLKAALEEAQQKESAFKAALEEAQHQHQDEDTAFAALKESLEESHRKEGALQQQISDLQSDLAHQHKSLDKLQKELEKIADLKKEFEQAKKAASQLAQANEKLTEEINALKKENEHLATQRSSVPQHQPGRPIQTESGKSPDFAKNSWLL